MKKINLFITAFVLAILLSAVAISQISPNPITNIITKTKQITPTISLEEKDTCTTEFYDEVQDVYENCIYYYNYTSCLNTTGPNTGCSLQQNTRNSQCKASSITTVKNTTECKANELIVSMNQGVATLKKQLDFADWGPCVYEEQNSCLVVTCVSLYDGAHNGQFVDCNGGKSCQRFEICDNSIKALYKNSRDDFIDNDDSFNLPRLAVKEVGE